MIKRSATAHPALFKKLDEHDEVKGSGFASFYNRAYGQNVTVSSTGSEVTDRKLRPISPGVVMAFRTAQAVRLG